MLLNFFTYLWPVLLWAELGQFTIKTPPPSTKPKKVLADMFAQARGMKAFEVQTLHYNRVACSRRLFTESGASLEGDGDIKATNIGMDLAEVEFPTYIHLSSFNSVSPFDNKVESMETMTGRILIKTHPWKDDLPLKIHKTLNIQFEDGSKKLVESIAEIRVAEEGYSAGFVIKETVMLPKKFSIYFLCR